MSFLQWLGSVNNIKPSDYSPIAFYFVLVTRAGGRGIPRSQVNAFCCHLLERRDFFFEAHCILMNYELDAAMSRIPSLHWSCELLADCNGPREYILQGYCFWGIKNLRRSPGAQIWSSGYEILLFNEVLEHLSSIIFVPTDQEKTAVIRDNEPD